MKTVINLLPQDALIKTGNVDHADWNYRPILGTISSARFRLINTLLKGKHVEKLLEIGYGSGVFLPQLSKHADTICGIDIHEKHEEVTKKLHELNINAELVSSGAEKMPWTDGSFDTVVAVSALEFVNDLDKVCLEVKRVLKDDGSFVIVTPGKSPIIDFGLKVMTGVSAKKDFGTTRENIIPTLRKHFDIQQELNFPKRGNSIIKLYTALELTPKKQ